MKAAEAYHRRLAQSLSLPPAREERASEWFLPIRTPPAPTVPTQSLPISASLLQSSALFASLLHLASHSQPQPDHESCNTVRSWSQTSNAHGYLCALQRRFHTACSPPSLGSARQFVRARETRPALLLSNHRATREPHHKSRDPTWLRPSIVSASRNIIVAASVCYRDRLSFVAFLSCI